METRETVPANSTAAKIPKDCSKGDKGCPDLIVGKWKLRKGGTAEGQRVGWPRI